MNGPRDDLGEGIRDVTMGALFSRAPESPASPGAVDSDAAVAKALDHPTGHASGTPLAARAPPSHRARLPRPRSLLAGPPRLRVPAPSERSLALSPDRSAIWSCRRNAARPAPHCALHTRPLLHAGGLIFSPRLTLA
jgi:hypothetical protein